MKAKLFALLQYLLPKYLMTAAIYRIARIRNETFKDWLIVRFVDVFDVELDDVPREVPEDFRDFNDFFTRELTPDARPVSDDAWLVSPCDGRISQCGNVTSGRIIQAKGIDYSVEEMLAVNLDDAERYRNGQFATIYLAPFNYHRVHCPVDGELRSLHYVPGDLFSVNAATAQNIPGLFRRNERLNMHIDTEHGPVFLSMVGALNVGSITTPWTGEIRPKSSGIVEELPTNGHDTRLRRGDLLGWFNMGSTVVMLTRDVDLLEEMEAGHVVKMGEAMGRRSDS